MERKSFKRRRVYQRGGDKEIRVSPRKTLTEAQFKFDDLFRQPFTGRRGCDEEGNLRWEPIDPTPPKTGVRALDDFVTWLSSGKGTVSAYCRRRGFKPAELSAMLLLLTDVPTASEWHRRWQLRTADALLRYTSLKMKEVAEKARMGTVVTLNAAMAREYDLSPSQRRWQLQKQGDAGRYRL